MPAEKAPAAVEGVYEKSPGSGIWYVRYRLGGKLVRKRLGTRQAAIAYIRKVKILLATNEGFVPATARQSAKTDKELTVVRNGITLAVLCDDLLSHIKSRPEEYRDQKNPVGRIAKIGLAFGDRLAVTIRPREAAEGQQRRHTLSEPRGGVPASSLTPAADRFMRSSERTAA